jgi:hypothetical protein
MSAVRMFVSIPALVLALSSLAGCYDLSAPSGPRREDFLRDPGAAETSAEAQQQGEQAQAERSDQAAVAATKAVAASGPAPTGASEPNDTGLVLTPAAGTEITIGDYVARHLQPAPNRD